MLTSLLTSPTLRDVQRGTRRALRRIKRADRVVHFFCQIDDPYGPAALHYLARLADRHALTIAFRLVPAPDQAAAPEAARLAAYGRRDAARVEQALGLGDGRVAAEPAPDRVAQGQRIAAATLGREDAASALAAIARALFDGGDALDALAARYGETDPAPALAEGAAERTRLGHYLGSVTAFEGECYWGVDRLHYLEARLAAEDESDAPPLCPVLDPGPYPVAPPSVATPPRLDCYLSFRSPYSLVAAERIGALAAAYGATLNLKFVLPMVMRGLPVPAAKRMYITLDTKREAARYGIGFGTIHDPVGLGVERGLAVLHHVMPGGKGLDFAISFLRGAFADGIDMTGDAGLMKVAARAGVTEGEVRAGLADERWRSVAEANRTDMFALGLWGVPSFQVDDCPGWWGQDRLWMIEDDLRAATGLPAIDRRMA
ncbi:MULTISPECIES: DsbA family protein [Sphingomonas]|uniref:DsbA family protein n=1 Tax=Sphingomonas TaxID=13687 RepID=UPI00082CCA3E|nr:DsbA family protein [Sphingomonas sp. CCH10-B3]